MRKWIWLPIIILTIAVVVSLASPHRSSTGQRILAEMEKSSGPARSALMILDYSPDEAAVAQAMRETLERGTGTPFGFELNSSDSTHKQWIKTSDAVFFWSPPQGPTPLRQSLETTHQKLVAFFARGPFDDAETDAAFKIALSQLTSPDESLFLAWANADRGVLAALDDRPSALRQALLLLTLPNDGPLLSFDCSGRHIYLLPASPTADLSWCEIQAYEPNGPMAWSGMLRVNGHPPAERVRTLAVALVRQASVPPATHSAATPLIPPF